MDFGYISIGYTSGIISKSFGISSQVVVKNHLCVNFNTNIKRSISTTRTRIYASAIDQSGSALESLRRASSREEFIDALSNLQKDNVTPRWNSYPVNYRPVNEGELRMVTKLNPEAFLGSPKAQISDLRNTFLIVLFGCTTLSIIAAAILPPQAGYYASYLIGGIVIVFVGIGSSSPALLQSFSASLSSRFSSDYKSRLVRHEAAHLLVAYLVGLPIASFTISETNRKSALNAVELYELDGGRDEVNKVSVVSLAGAVGEAMKYGNAEGALADLEQLQKLLIRANPPLRSKEIELQTRWSALQAYTILKKHEPILDALTEAMENGADVAKCVDVIENTNI